MTPGQLTFCFGLKSTCTDLEEASNLLTKANRRTERQEALTMRHVMAISPMQVSMDFDFFFCLGKKAAGHKRQMCSSSRFSDGLSCAHKSSKPDARCSLAAVNGAVRAPTELPHWLKLEIAKA